MTFPKMRDSFSPLLMFSLAAACEKVGAWSFVGTLGTFPSPTCSFVTLWGLSVSARCVSTKPFAPTTSDLICDTSSLMPFASSSVASRCSLSSRTSFALCVASLHSSAASFASSVASFAPLIAFPVSSWRSPSWLCLIPSCLPLSSSAAIRPSSFLSRIPSSLSLASSATTLAASANLIPSSVRMTIFFVSSMSSIYFCTFRSKKVISFEDSIALSSLMLCSISIVNTADDKINSPFSSRISISQ